MYNIYVQQAILILCMMCGLSSLSLSSKKMICDVDKKVTKRENMLKIILDYIRGNGLLSEYKKGNCKGVRPSDLYELPELKRYERTYKNEKSFKGAIRCFMQDVGFRYYSLVLKYGSLSTAQMCYRRQIYNVPEKYELLNIKRGRWLFIDDFKTMKDMIVHK